MDDSCIDINGIGPMMRKISDAMDRRITENMTRLGLTARQGMVLGLLGMQEDHEMSLKDLEHVFDVAQATMAGIVARIEEKEFVETFFDPNDRRAKRVRLTEKGVAACNDGRDGIERVEMLVKSALTPDELDDLQRKLQKIYETVR